MSRKVVRLTVDHLARLPESARTCLFWEIDPVRRSRVSPEEAAGEKEAWLSHVLLEWGSCGRVALVDDQAVGYAVYAPQAYLPGAAAIATAPVSPDALLLALVYVDPAHRGGGLGRMLVQGMARDLILRGGIRAVETFGDSRRTSTGGPGDAHHDPCLTPTDFLASVGFKTHRPHVRTPRLRMELRSAVTWREEVEAAVERLVDVVRPTPAPAPAPAVQTRNDPPDA